MRDALTLFDENAALLWAPLPIWQALQDKQWQDLFVTHRGLWSECQLQLFGHALLEKMLSPYKGITAHVWCMPLPDCRNDEQIDACLCQQLTPDNLSSKPFAPLPLAARNEIRSSSFMLIVACNISVQESDFAVRFRPLTAYPFRASKVALSPRLSSLTDRGRSTYLLFLLTSNLLMQK